MKTISEDADLIDRVGETLAAIREKFAEADQLSKRAEDCDERQDAGELRDRARDEVYVAEYTLGRLGLVLLEHALKHHRTETLIYLRPLIAQVLANDLPGALAALKEQRRA